MRTEMTLALLRDELTKNCGDMFAAARTSGVSLFFVEQWRKDDPDVHASLLEAERVGTQGLVSAAIQRAVHGVDKGIYYKGELVDTERQYSDGLLTTLLKAKVDDFKADPEAGVHVNVNIANVMPRAATYDEWLQMRESTLNPVAALPAPVETIEMAEFSEVQGPFTGIEL